MIYIYKFVAYFLGLSYKFIYVNVFHVYIKYLCIRKMCSYKMQILRFKDYTDSH